MPHNEYPSITPALPSAGSSPDSVTFKVGNRTLIRAGQWTALAGAALAPFLVAVAAAMLLSTERLNALLRARGAVAAANHG
jgi:hypothetical protein